MQAATALGSVEVDLGGAGTLSLRLAPRTLRPRRLPLAGHRRPSTHPAAAIRTTVPRGSPGRTHRHLILDTQGPGSAAGPSVRAPSGSVAECAERTGRLGATGATRDPGVDGDDTSVSPDDDRVEFRDLGELVRQSPRSARRLSTAARRSRGGRRCGFEQAGAGLEGGEHLVGAPRPLSGTSRCRTAGTAERPATALPPVDGSYSRTRYGPGGSLRVARGPGPGWGVRRRRHETDAGREQQRPHSTSAAPVAAAPPRDGRARQDDHPQWHEEHPRHDRDLPLGEAFALPWRPITESCLRSYPLSFRCSRGHLDDHRSSTLLAFLVSRGRPLVVREVRSGFHGGWWPLSAFEGVRLWVQWRHSQCPGAAGRAVRARRAEVSAARCCRRASRWRGSGCAGGRRGARGPAPDAT